MPPFDPVNNPLVKLNSVGAVKDTNLPECVFDESTGLLWENHTASAGIHSVKNRFTNLNNGEDNDTSGHIAAVNEAKLCGHDDWRLPTLQELHTLVDYGVKSSIFGRTRTKTSSHILHWSDLAYWSNTSNVTRVGGLQAGVLHFGDYTRPVRFYNFSAEAAVRLVRGAAWQGPRYAITTKSFLGDAPNNAIVDRTTGLIWRRCEGESSWDGAGCKNPSDLQTHEQALLAAKAVWERNPGWRMPNVQEVFSVYGPVGKLPFALDPDYFRFTTDSLFTWSTTPRLEAPLPDSLLSFVFVVGFSVDYLTYMHGFVDRTDDVARTRYVWTAN